MCDFGSFEPESYETPELFAARIVEAGSAITCDECRRPIPEGVGYELARWRIDQDWFVFKTCPDCQELRKRLCSDGWAYGDLIPILRRRLGGMSQGARAVLDEFVLSETEE